jgi:hypothetical protein
MQWIGCLYFGCHSNWNRYSFDTELAPVLGLSMQIPHVKHDIPQYMKENVFKPVVIIFLTNNIKA